jgi:hypothetical protein
MEDLIGSGFDRAVHCGRRAGFVPGLRDPGRLVASGHPFVTAPNKFAALASIDAIVEAMSGLRAIDQAAI